MSADMARLLNFLMGQTAGVGPPAVWAPAVDVYRVGEGWLLKFDLAGVRPEDIQLHAAGRKLTVSGRMRD